MRTRPIRVLWCLLGASLLAQGCSNPLEDRRITLCKDIALAQLKLTEPVDWQEVATDFLGPNGVGGAVVRIAFRPPFTTNSDRPSRISCQYRYDAVDDTALGLANPLSNYSGSPERVEVNGQSLSRSQIAEAVKQAMVKQARGVFDRD